MSAEASAFVILLVIVVVVAWSLVLKARQDLRLHEATYRWTDDDLDNARRETIDRSHAVVSGKVREYLAPLFPDFLAQFDPRDARFLGTPIDFVVFDGLDRGDDVTIAFVEIKTGRSSLSRRERRVRDAVEAGRIEYQLLRLPAAVGVSPPDDDRGSTARVSS